MPRYIEVDVSVSENCDWPVVKVFEAHEAPREVTRVVARRPDGTTGPCAVTGWEGGKPAPAFVARVGDSGEGVVLLVYGGDEGIRLKDFESIEPWDMANASQWGEPCLLLAPDTETA
ncbi:MAG: hypothetical protein FJ318_03245 [SAR202 cluster bacterium]|nr:hypothetical protein [SAR202 cluster bacterium]